MVTLRGLYQPRNVRIKAHVQMTDKGIAMLFFLLLCHVEYTCHNIYSNGMVWYGMDGWYGMVWYGMVWYGIVWYCMVWYGMVWYGMTDTSYLSVNHLKCQY